MEFKRRTLKIHRLRRESYEVYPPGSGNIVLGHPGWIDDVPVVSQQLTFSEGHPFPKGKGVRDVGGPFDTIRMDYINPHGDTLIQAAYTGGAVEKKLTFTPCPWSFYGPYAEFSVETSDFTKLSKWVHQVIPEGNLVARGTDFIAQTLPTNPVVDGSVGLAELIREGVPSMVGASLLRERANLARAAGSEYLNLEFGWKPLVSDVRNAAKAITESHAILTNLIRNSGKNVRRKRMAPPITQFTRAEGTNYPAAINGEYVVGTPRYRSGDWNQQETWFSGCYTYHYEPSQMDNLERIVANAHLLYGLELTPEVLWNLAPWSWLVDWVANVGSIMHNFTAFQSDGLVMRYGYVMEKTTRRVTRVNEITPKFLPGCPSTFTDEFRGVRKRRVKASPFGFGIDSSAFTTRQWAILAALGITRGLR